MLEIALPGELMSSGSIRVNVTAAGSAAFAFFETKRRPVVVDAQSVAASLVLREIQLTLPPLRVVPYRQFACVEVVHVRRPLDVGSPSRTQSPHCVAKVPV